MHWHSRYYHLLGFSGELDELGGPDVDWIDNDSDSELLLEVLRCVISISNRLGKTTLAIFYESLMSTPIIPFGEIVGRILKILENGYGSSVGTIKRSDLHAGYGWERELTDKKNLRKFSIEMMLSLHTLCNKGASWGRVLDVVESFLKYFVPRKMSHKVQPQRSSDVNTSILVHATSQISKVMLESALDVLLFLNYMVSVSGQVSFFSRTYCRFLKMLTCNGTHLSYNGSLFFCFYFLFLYLKRSILINWGPQIFIFNFCA